VTSFKKQLHCSHSYFPGVTSVCAVTYSTHINKLSFCSHAATSPETFSPTVWLSWGLLVLIYLLFICLEWLKLGVTPVSSFLFVSLERLELGASLVASVLLISLERLKLRVTLVSNLLFVSLKGLNWLV
jgi:hypothetical protein